MQRHTMFMVSLGCLLTACGQEHTQASSDIDNPNTDWSEDGNNVCGGGRQWSAARNGCVPIGLAMKTDNIPLEEDAMRRKSTVIVIHDPQYYCDNAVHVLAEALPGLPSAYAQEPERFLAEFFIGALLPPNTSDAEAVARIHTLLADADMMVTVRAFSRRYNVNIFGNLQMTLDAAEKAGK